jgi:prepilin-type N-terminal cleavage/methylation domain-containing protein
MRLSGLSFDENGYTLTEVLVVVSLIVIMSSVGYSGFSGWQKRERVRTAVHQLAGHLKEARMKSIEKCTMHTIAFTATQYTIFIDINDDLVRQNNEVVVRLVDLTQLDPSLRMAVTGNYPLRYTSKGLPINAIGGFGSGAIAFINDDGNSGKVTIAALGSVTVETNF